MGNGTGLSSLPVNATGPGPNTASETDVGHFNDCEYSTELKYNGSTQDSRDDEDMGDSGEASNRRRVREDRSIRKAVSNCE